MATMDLRIQGQRRGRGLLLAVVAAEAAEEAEAVAVEEAEAAEVAAEEQPGAEAVEAESSFWVSSSISNRCVCLLKKPTHSCVAVLFLLARRRRRQYEKRRERENSLVGRLCLSKTHFFVCLAKQQQRQPYSSFIHSFIIYLVAFVTVWKMKGRFS